MHFASVVFPYMQGISISPCLVGFGIKEKLWRAWELVGVLFLFGIFSGRVSIEMGQDKWVDPHWIKVIHKGQVGLTCCGCGL